MSLTIARGRLAPNPSGSRNFAPPERIVYVEPLELHATSRTSEPFTGPTKTTSVARANAFRRLFSFYDIGVEGRRADT